MREFSEGEWQQVRDGIFWARLQPASVNAGLVVGHDGALLIDTGSSPEQGRRLAASAAQRAGVPVTHVVVTHWHFDHFFGLAGVQGFATDAGQPLVSIGHETLMAHLDAEEVDPAIIERDLGFSASELVVPSDPVSVVRALDLGGRRVEILFPGPAHTDGDLVVLVPDARVAFVGDLVEQSGDPAIGSDARASMWPASLDAVLSSAGHADDWLFVPGHGEPVDSAFVADQRVALAAFFATAEDLLRSGVSVDDVVVDFNGPREYDWPFAPASVVDALPNVFAELRRAGVQAKRTLPISSL